MVVGFFFRKTKLAGVSLRFNVILKNGGWLFNAQKKEKKNFNITN